MVLEEDEAPSVDEIELKRLWDAPQRQRCFVDCGFHQGEGITEFKTKLGIDEDWLIHSFEVQPVDLEAIPAWLREHPGFHLHNKAVWFEECELQFKPSNDTCCTAIVDCDHEFPEFDEVHKTSLKWAESQSIEAVDIWNFISKLGDKDVYLKLDIEGSEYKVLRSLLAREQCPNNLRIMWVETHERFVPGESRESTKQLLANVRDLGVVVRPWF